MVENGIKLDDKDIYLLGVLAEGNGGRLIDTKTLPRGCSPAQAAALVKAGYVIETPRRFADGRCATAYDITAKGLSVWNRCRFT